MQLSEKRIFLHNCGGKYHNGNYDFRLFKEKLTMTMRRHLCLMGLMAILASGVGQQMPPASTSEMVLARGQVLYVPVYSHIFAGTASGEFNLTTTLSLRNTDLKNAITITSVRYYDSAGTLVRAYLEERRQLGPLAATEVVVEEKDTSGGAGANFIVEWSAQTPVTPPVVEAVMISTTSSQGLSFVTWARVLEQTP